MATAHSSSKAMMPALSLKTDRQCGPRPLVISSSVARAIVSLSRLPKRISRRCVSCWSGWIEGIGSPRYRIGLLSVLCTQCSDQVWARVSSSMSVGSRPQDLKCDWIASISGSDRNRCPSRLSLRSSASAREVISMWRRANSYLGGEGGGSIGREPTITSSMQSFPKSRGIRLSSASSGIGESSKR